MTFTTNSARNKVNLVLYQGEVSKEKVKAKAKVPVKGKSLKIHTIGNKRRPKLLEKMGRDVDNSNIWNQETYRPNFLKREDVRLCAERECAELGCEHLWSSASCSVLCWRLAWPTQPHCHWQDRSVGYIHHWPFLEEISLCFIFTFIVLLFPEKRFQIGVGKQYMSMMKSLMV